MDAAFDHKALYAISYGLYVVTSQLDGKLNGQIANTAIQVTAEPPRIAVCVNKENLTHEYISESGVFAASVLDESVTMEFIGLFGFKSGRDVDKLSQVAYKPGVTGCPVVTDYAISTIEAKVIGRLDVGTHTIFVGDVVGCEVLSDGRPLTYADYHDKKKGRAPKSAPTYRGEPARKEPGKKEDVKMKRYVCNICGWVYDPAEGDPNADIPAGTPFKDLPDDWVCPICGAEKDQFEPQEE